MKGYERAYDVRLPLRLPVIVRVDGRAFHTWCRKLERPFDGTFVGFMNGVGLRLCEGLQGARLGFIQSDEVSVLLHNYRTLQTQAWLDNRLQKMVSHAGSIASAQMASEAMRYTTNCGKPRLAQFDARAFVLPEAEVANYFWWRQRDAERNSIQMLARSLYSHKQLHRKNSDDLQEMCFARGHNWNDLLVSERRGRCVVRVAREVDGVERHEWQIDQEPPRFVNEGREYVERLLVTEDEARP
jgi:tRNA(His) 5'-end guanylyltransferase